MISSIIIDDEKKAAEVLHIKLRELSLGVNVLAKIYDSQEAIEYLNQNSVDLVFLDIEMPVKSGFDILRDLNDLNFEIIFITGYQNYAIQAIQYSALGYILKPVDDDDLILAINNAKNRIFEKKSGERNQILLDNLVSSNKDKKIGIPTMYGLEFIKVKDIIRCEGLQKLTKIFIEGKGSITSSYNIGEFIKLLEGYNFFSTHKSHFINLDKIHKYLKEGVIYMEDGSTVPLARRRKQIFLDQLKKV